MIPRALLASAALAMTLLAQPPKEPQFTDYPAAIDQTTSPAVPKFSTPGQRKFRTVIREGAAKGPNFAGHYTIVEWGCGTACVQIAVVDNKTGAVHDGPFGNLPKALLCVNANTDETGAGIFYRRNSSLLVVKGCPNFVGCAAFYYLWNGAEFKLLQRVKLKTAFACEP